MGDTSFKVNDDGSVTIAERLPDVEKHILDILRIEKAKGGIFGIIVGVACLIWYKSLNSKQNIHNP